MLLGPSDLRVSSESIESEEETGGTPDWYGDSMGAGGCGFFGGRDFDFPKYFEH